MDEFEVRACRMESACRVAIIFSINSACCSRPTSSRASKAVSFEKLKKPLVKIFRIKFVSKIVIIA